MEGLYHCQANYVPLSPISFLQRAAFVYEKSPSIIYGTTTYTWKETRDRCVKLASALSTIGVSTGHVSLNNFPFGLLCGPSEILAIFYFHTHTSYAFQLPIPKICLTVKGVSVVSTFSSLQPITQVASFAPNTPAHYELHFGVPMAGAILSALNTSLDPPTLATTLQQLEPKLIFVDHQYIQTVTEAFKLLPAQYPAQPRLVLTGGKTRTMVPLDTLDYDDLVSIGKPDFKIILPNNECDPLSINFTSGSTGKPKGAIYSHRAAYLNSLAIIFRYEMKKMPVFLWTVDMFRCNGWCFPWAVAALGGTNVCLRKVTAEVIFDSIVTCSVTHLCGPPTILEKIAAANSKTIIRTRVDVIVAGPLPAPEVMAKVAKLGFDIHHGYGMTEALGPMMDRSLTSSEMNDNDNNDNNNDEVRSIKCHEGTHNLMMEDVDVKDHKTMSSVAWDGKTVGEVMFRGNVVMSGYLKNLGGTQKAFEGGWYRTRDIGVRNPDGDIVIKDRGSDSIIIKGDIVSSLEIERVIRSHPFVKEVAVVGKPDSVIGETPCAFVTLKDASSLSSNNIKKFCEDNLLSLSMIPTNVSFGNLPVNSTGKVLKFVLREKAKAIDDINGR